MNTQTQYIFGTVNKLKNRNIIVLGQQIFNTLLVTNPEAASGGSDGDDINEIRHRKL